MFGMKSPRISNWILRANKKKMKEIKVSWDKISVSAENFSHYKLSAFVAPLTINLKFIRNAKKLLHFISSHFLWKKRKAYLRVQEKHEICLNTVSLKLGSVLINLCSFSPWKLAKNLILRLPEEELKCLSLWLSDTAIQRWQCRHFRV